MDGTTDTGEPAYMTTRDTGKAQDGAAVYDVGFACIVLLFIIILCYIFYKCKRRSIDNRSLPLTVTSIRTVTESDSDDDRCMRHSTGLDDNILSTFPTFLYSDAIKTTHKLMETEHAVDYGSGCSICLAAYRLEEVVRLLPECGHLFHSSCIDTWLKVHSTCPICRKSLTTLTELT